MSKLAKSLSDLDSLADEVLSKSIKDDDKELKPDEISENVPDDTADDNSPDVKDSEESEESEDKKETEEDSDDVKKSDVSKPVSEDDDEDSEDFDDEEDESEAEDKEDLEKSIKSDFISESEIKKGIDASEFLSCVVEILSKSLADAVGEIQINRDDNNHNSSILAKSLQATLRLNKSMADDVSKLKKENAELKKSIIDGLGEIKDTLDEVLSQPVSMRKSVKNIQVMDRDFQKSLNGSADSRIENLSKSQIMDILMSEMSAGNPSVTAGDIVAFESGAPLHAGLVSLVNSKCR